MSWIPSSKAVRYLNTAAGAYALVGGLISFVGWAAGIYRLRDWAGSGISIEVNSALAAMAAGTALLLPRGHASARVLSRALAFLVAAAGSITLFEHITGWNVGLDTLMFDEPHDVAARAAPGRMGPPAAASFLAIGIALPLLTRSSRGCALSAALGVAVLGIGTLSLTGHWYGAEAMYAIPQLTIISIPMASMLVALGLGVIAANPDREPMRTLCEDSTAGLLARRLVPLALTMPLVLGWIRVRGQEAGLYDTAFGTSMRSVLEVVALAGVLWWSVQAIRARDIQQCRAEDDLRNSERRLIQTLESITDGFATFDREWRFSYVNSEAEHLLRRPRSELIGRVIWDLYPEIVGSTLYEEIHRAAGERVMVEVDGADLAEAGRHLSIRLYPSFDGGLSVYFQDITERKRGEEVLKEADRRKDDFLATLAHELRNPLAPIRNAAGVLLSKMTPDPAMKWAAEVISRQVRHMARLLEDLLDVSRISRNRFELRKERVEISTVIQCALEAARPAIDGAGHELTLVLPREPVYVDGDPVRLTQVFSNLLNNAAKYTEPTGHLRLTAYCEDEDVVVCLRDTGIGIAPDMLPRVFDLFAQATPAAQRSQGGLGIGLSLAKAVIELHGGRIEARSGGLGAGSEFVVRLSRVRLAGAAAPALVKEDMRGTVVRRLLVVDDLKDSADSLAMLLKTLGHDVRTAYDGAEAIAAAATFEPDAIFLDLGMPMPDGFEVCQRIRAVPWGKNMLIVALTGWGQPEDRRRTGQAGFDHHLIKPVDVGALMAILASLPTAEVPVQGRLEV